ncbi:hypothetical protein [Kitasatospora purpeofusca]|uniref:hypothetical protein n=1 Tax=Kitasatospora purpeofusca TaxID=67352 RepID=UPI0036D33D4F
MIVRREAQRDHRRAEPDPGRDRQRRADDPRRAEDAREYSRRLSYNVRATKARAIVANSTGRYQDALAAAREAGRGSRPLEVGGATWALPEFIEAAARTEAPDEAADALRP